MFKENNNQADAASANITVTDNNQAVSIDQATGGQVIQRTSTVTVRNPSATYGYTLSAKVEDNNLPGSTINIFSSASTLCTQTAPCLLSASAFTDILTISSSNATNASGDTSLWNVIISIPANAGTGNYIIDIEYDEHELRPGILSVTTLQEVTRELCNTTPSGAMVSLRDTRDNTYYRVKKMIDGNCWMVDNLALDLTSTYTGKPSWGTAPVTVSGSTTSVNNVPQQAVNNNTANQGQIPNNGSAKASYLYNWCAALADTSSACAASVAATQYNTVISGVRDTSGTATSQPAVTGICPAPFRLPKGGPEATSGNKDTTANEFGKLDIAMGGTGANRASANTYPLFTGTAATNTNWLGVLSGYYYNGLVCQGSEGYWWSSTAYDASSAYYLYLYSSNTNVRPAYSNSKYVGGAVRCVL